MKTLLTKAALLGLSGLHFYWGRGGSWPGKNQQDLGRKVFSQEDTLPPPAACYAVAGALAICAAGVQLSEQEGPQRRWGKLICLGGGGVFLARGVLGYVSPRYREANTEFKTLNGRFYSPLCLALGLSLLQQSRQ